MKFIITVLALAIGVHAQALPIVKNKKVSRAEFSKLLAPLTVNSGEFKQRRPLPDDMEEIKPIRQGKLKIEIFRTELHTQPDGSITFTNDSLCLGNVPVNVYDLRGAGLGSWPDGPNFSCNGDLEGVPVNVEVTGDILLNQAKLFSDEADGEIKQSIARLMVKDGSQIKQFAASFVTARSLSTPSLLGYIGGENFQSCVPANDGSGNIVCSINEGVIYSATIEFLD